MPRGSTLRYDVPLENWSYPVNKIVVKTLIFWAVIMVSAILLWLVVRTASTNPPRSAPEISYSEFMSQVNAGAVSKVVITGTRADGSYRDGTAFAVNLPASQEQMLTTLQQKGVEIRYTNTNNQPFTWLVNLAPLILLAGLWFYLVRQKQKKKGATTEGSSATTNAPWPQS